jgi:hypothetical protein
MVQSLDVLVLYEQGVCRIQLLDPLLIAGYVQKTGEYLSPIQIMKFILTTSQSPNLIQD